MLLGCGFSMGIYGEWVLLGLPWEVLGWSGYLIDCEAKIARRQDLVDC